MLTSAHCLAREEFARHCVSLQPVPSPIEPSAWPGLLQLGRFKHIRSQIILCYCRISLRADIRDSLTVTRSGATGETLAYRLLTFMRPKCHPLLLDSALNSLFTVRWVWKKAACVYRRNDIPLSSLALS